MTPTASGSASWSPPGNYAYPAGSNFFLTGEPLKGVNPPPPADRYPRPFKPDVPCETQQAPDLRSNPLDPPTPTKVNFDSPQVKAGVADATAKAVTWLRKTLEREVARTLPEGLLDAAHEPQRDR